MTHTHEIEYHRERTVIHFGSPAGARYWTPEPQPDSPEVSNNYFQAMKKRARSRS